MLAARLTAAAIGLSLASAGAAQSLSQWTPGSELVGHQVKVQTNGVTNLVTFQSDGIAQISSPSGATVVDANWTADGHDLCLRTSGTFDCYPYARPFQGGQPLDLVSNCGVMSRWLAMLPPGERG